nr:uncharacterized protein LOC109153113 [Ipomoea batatas]GME20801.1 uncharacterized protein LOC109153113 [Ipomoea batatas]
MAWNGATTRPPTAPPAQTFPPAVTTPTNSVPNSIPAGAVFDPHNAASPFYLHPNENLSLVLVSTVGITTLGPRQWRCG